MFHNSVFHYECHNFNNTAFLALRFYIPLDIFVTLGVGWFRTGTRYEKIVREHKRWEISFRGFFIHPQLG